MAQDIACHIVELMDARQAAETENLKASTLRVLRITAKVVAFDGSDDEDPDDAVTTETEIAISAFKTMCPPATEPIWVLGFNDAQLPVAAPHASDFIVHCVTEQIKLATHDWLLDVEREDLLATFEMTISITLSLGTSDKPWCVFREHKQWEDTAVDTWAKDMTTYIETKCTQLIDIAQHVVSVPAM
jgi:hypothetical protein